MASDGKRRRHHLDSSQSKEAAARSGSNGARRGRDELGWIVGVVRGLGLQQPVDAFGRRDCEWVVDESLVTVLDVLSHPHAHEHTWQGERYDVRVCYVDAHTKGVDIPDPDSDELPDRNLALLVIHSTSETCGTHFSAMLVNARLRLVHAFDTMTYWPGPRIKYTLAHQFPRMRLLEGGYRIQNHTGRVRQRGATCGPWSLWLILAYAFNYGGCRGSASSSSGGEEAIDYACFKQADVERFWRAVTR